MTIPESLDALDSIVVEKPFTTTHISKARNIISSLREQYEAAQSTHSALQKSHATLNDKHADTEKQLSNMKSGNRKVEVNIQSPTRGIRKIV